MPRVCVVVPILNEVRYVAAALDTLFAQAGVDLEVLVYDAGSTDGTLEVLRRYPARVTVEPGLGQMAAINRGWRRTEAEFVTWMAGDDRLKPNALCRLAAALQAHPRAGAAHGDAEIIDEHGRVIGRLTPGDVQFRDLAFEFSLVPQTALIRRTALERSGLFDERRRLAADHDLFLRLAQYFPLVYIPEMLAEYRIHADSEDAKNLKAVGAATLDVMTCFFERPDLTSKQQRLRRRGLAGAHLASGSVHCLAGDRRAGWAHGWHALRLHAASVFSTRRGLGLLARLLWPLPIKAFALRNWHRRVSDRAGRWLFERSS